MEIRSDVDIADRTLHRAHVFFGREVPICARNQSLISNESVPEFCLAYCHPTTDSTRPISSRTCTRDVRWIDFKALNSKTQLDYL